MKFSIIYIATVVLINMAFTYIQPVVLFDGTIWSVGSILAGLVFVVRDYAQREVGHKFVLLLMIVAAALSYLMADPFVAMASLTAFAISELSDYLVFTFKKGNFKQKVIWSSVVGVPIDTIVFLTIISSLSWFSFVVMCISKMIVLSYLIWKK